MLGFWKRQIVLPLRSVQHRLRLGDDVWRGVARGCSGAVLWVRPIPHHIDPTGPTATIFPIVVGNTVVVGARDGPVYEFDRATGDIR